MPVHLWEPIAADLACSLGLMLYSEKPFLYTTFTTMLLDKHCRQLDLTRGRPRWEREHSSALALGSMRDFAGGITVAIAAGARAYQVVSTRLYDC